jgi:hypothetical protein
MWLDNGSIYEQKNLIWVSNSDHPPDVLKWLFCTHSSSSLTAPLSLRQWFCSIHHGGWGRGLEAMRFELAHHLPTTSSNWLTTPFLLFSAFLLLEMPLPLSKASPPCWPEFLQCPSHLSTTLHLQLSLLFPAFIKCYLFHHHVNIS